MAKDLARAYRACARATRRRARNFYFAFLSLRGAQRHAVYALYAFCNEADCVADDGATAGKPAAAGESSVATLSMGGLQEVRSGASNEGSDDLAARRDKLQTMRERLAHAARGTPETERDLALADAIARFGVREADLRDVIAGVEMDLAPMHVETLDDLRTYCYRVASAVGLATLPILTGGARPTDAAREAAIDLGLGMQYVNVLRDVDEDLDLGRIYLPSAELAAHGVDPSQLAARRMTDRLRAALASHAERARLHLDRGRLLLAHLPERSRACPWLLSEIYARILRRIVDGDYPVFEHRVALSATEKLWLLASSPWRRT